MKKIILFVPMGVLAPRVCTQSGRLKGNCCYMFLQCYPSKFENPEQPGREKITGFERKKRKNTNSGHFVLSAMPKGSAHIFLLTYF